MAQATEDHITSAIYPTPTALGVFRSFANFQTSIHDLENAIEVQHILSEHLINAFGATVETTANDWHVGHVARMIMDLRKAFVEAVEANWKVLDGRPGAAMSDYTTSEIVVLGIAFAVIALAIANWWAS